MAELLTDDIIIEKLNDIRAVLVYTDKHSYDVSGADIMYGNEFIKIEYYD